MTDAATLDPSAHSPTPLLDDETPWSTDPGPTRSGSWPPDPWYRRALRGAIAGCAGTALMTPIQFAGASSAGAHAPPIEVTRRLHRLLPVARPRPRELQARGLALHLAFGAIAGALYGIAAPRRAREASGVAYAAALFGTSYLGYLPLLSLHPPAHRDDGRRQAANAAAHVVYGLTLAEAMRLSDPR
jgi:hypothetical protein